ncbi:MAG: exodeoxyribonuclease III [Pirellulales bacterium]|nr:exodeoxyribonuclease III [Pirellulales bacterium]
MKIATWNVNSVRARLDRLLAWLERAAPDVACLQEIKVTDEAFPREAIERAGYRAAVFGQKTYNGVAILSRREPDAVHRGLGDDPQARFLAAAFGKLSVLCAYVPNGQMVGSDKWAYKLDWLAQLRAYLEKNHKPSGQVVLCGDLNIAPDDLDVAEPEVWADSVLCHPEGRAALESVVEWGLVDVVRKHHPDGGVYSWWDYRQLAFPKNRGLRLDHILATEPLASRSTEAAVDRAERKGASPSDHAPVVAAFDARL